MGRKYTHTALYAVDTACTQAQLEQRHLRRHRETIIHCRRHARQSNIALPHMGYRRQAAHHHPLPRSAKDPRHQLEQQPLLARLGTKARLPAKRGYKHGTPHRGRIMESHPRTQARGPCTIHFWRDCRRTIHHESH